MPKMELQILAFMDEISEPERNAKVGQCDQRIGYDVQSKHPGLPQVAHPVRHEIAFGQELPDVLDHRAGCFQRREPSRAAPRSYVF
jgi:hypothetical protein